MSGGASFNRKESFQAYATPPEFIAAVKRRFRVSEFAWDLAADAENIDALTALESLYRGAGAPTVAHLCILLRWTGPTAPAS